MGRLGFEVFLFLHFPFEESHEVGVLSDRSIVLILVHHNNAGPFLCSLGRRGCSLPWISACCEFGNILVFRGRHSPLLLAASLRRLLLGEIGGGERSVVFSFLGVAVVFLTAHAGSVHLPLEQHQPLLGLEDFAFSHVDLDVELSLAGRFGRDRLCIRLPSDQAYIEVGDFKRSGRLGRL